MSEPAASLLAVRALARWTGLRERLASGLRAGLGVAPAALLPAAVALTGVKLARLPEGPALRWWFGSLVLGGALVVGVALRAALRRRPAHHGARLLDRAHGLDDRLTSALCFAELPAERRTPLMEAAIADLLAQLAPRPGRHGDGAPAVVLSPRRAAPLRLPVEAAVAAVVALGLGGLGRLEWVSRHPVPLPVAGPPPFVLAADDLALFREVGAELERQADDPTAQAVVRRFQRLVDDLEARRVDRAEVFRRWAALQRELGEADPEARDALGAGLGRVARELEGSAPTRPTARALERRALGEARRELGAAAERLAGGAEAPRGEARQALQRALERAGRASAERQKELAEQRDQARRELGELEQQAAEPGPARERALGRKRAEAERRERQAAQHDRAAGRLERLEESLARAAERLERDDAAGAAEALQEASRALGELERQERAEQQRQGLRERLDELGDTLREAGGEAQRQRLEQFAERARGGRPPGAPSGAPRGSAPGQQPSPQPGAEGQGEQPGAPGDAAEGRLAGPRNGGARPQGTPRPGGPGAPEGNQGEQGQGQGEGEGQGQGERGGEPGGEQAGRGGGEPGGEQAGRGGGEPGAGDEGGGGEEAGGQAAGTGHDPALRGRATGALGAARDEQARAADTGQGTASRQVIHGAAQRGFRGREYRQIHRDYRRVAEEQMARDELPAGYRFYVKRYFQLIRPRE